MFAGASLTEHDGALFDDSQQCTAAQPTVHGSVIEQCTTVHPKNEEKNVGKNEEREKKSSTKTTQARSVSRLWKPTPNDVQFAISEGLSEQDCNWEAQKFVDYWLSNGKPKRDWSATWRNWIRRSVESIRNKPNGQASSGAQSAVEGIFDALDPEWGR